MLLRRLERKECGTLCQPLNLPDPSLRAALESMRVIEPSSSPAPDQYEQAETAMVVDSPQEDQPRILPLSARP